MDAFAEGVEGAATVSVDAVVGIELAALTYEFPIAPIMIFVLGENPVRVIVIGIKNLAVDISSVDRT